MRAIFEGKFFMVSLCQKSYQWFTSVSLYMCIGM